MPGRRSASALAAVVAVAVAVGLQAGGLLSGAENATVDARFGLRPTHRPADVVVVGVDSSAFSTLGHNWPFPRSWHGRVIDNLRRAGARAIVYDVQFTEPTTPREDLALYSAVRRAHHVVLATTEVDANGHTNVLGGDANLRRVGAQAGAANLDSTQGGTLRRVGYAVSGLPTLAVAGAEAANGRRVSASEFPKSGALIDFRGPPGTIPELSFAAVKKGAFDPRAVRGKVVVIGATAPTLQDVHATPASGHRLMSGPEVQANAIWTVLHDFPLRDAPWVYGLLALLLLACVGPAVALAGRPLLAAAATVPVAAAYAALAQLAFAHGLVLLVAAPLVALVVGAIAAVAVCALLDRRERRRVSAVNTTLERLVREATEEVRDTQLEVIRRLGQAAEWRDEETGEHIARMSGLCRRVARAAGWDEAEAEMLQHAAAMHDVGKIGIPDDILRKPGIFTPEERKVMETHAEIGAAILAGSTSPVLQLAEEVARTHHERWDGSGYPVGLIGAEIPVAGRIAAICDVFDALVSVRPYKPAWRFQDAVEEIRTQRGRQFDPEFVDAFLTLVPQLEAELLFDRDAGKADEADAPLNGILPFDALVDA